MLSHSDQLYQYLRVSRFPLAGSWCKASSFLWCGLSSARCLPIPNHSSSSAMTVYHISQSFNVNLLELQLWDLWRSTLVWKSFMCLAQTVVSTNGSLNQSNLRILVAVLHGRYIGDLAYSKYSQWIMVLVKDLISFWRLQAMNQKLFYIMNLCKTTRWNIEITSTFPPILAQFHVCHINSNTFTF